MTEEEFFDRFGTIIMLVAMALAMIAVGFGIYEMASELNVCKESGYQWVENVYEDSMECARVSAYGGETEYRWIDK